MTKTCHILLSSAGRRVALLRAFRESLAVLGVEGRIGVADMTAAASAYQDADFGVYSPRFADPDFIPCMLRHCKEHHIALLVPTLDPELKLFAEARAEFEAIGTTVAVSTPAVIEIGGDKQRTHDWLIEQGFPTPRQASIDEVSKDREGWPLPFLVKPVRGSSSIGVKIVHDTEALRTATHQGDYIAQSIAPGVEYSVDVYMDREGKCRCCVPRLRLETRAGEISKGMTVRHLEIETLTANLCEKLPGAFGVLTVQLFYDAQTKQMSVIEVNPRFGGGYPLTHEAGAVYTQWLIETSLGLASTATADTWRDGVVMLRYDDAVFTTKQQAGL